MDIFSQMIHALMETTGEGRGGRGGGGDGEGEGEKKVLNYHKIEKR